MAGHKRPAKVSAALEEELNVLLQEILDQIDDVSDKRRRITKKLSGHLKVLAETRDLVRRQLKGMDLDQVEIPGTELPAPAQDPVVAEILRIAGGIVERPGAEGDPEPLVFHQGGEKLDRWTAVVGPGEYLIELTDEGDWTARWMPYQGRSKVLAVAKPEAEAKEACRRHHLQRSADELLKKSGDDDLTRADRNGPPEKRK